MFAQSGYLSLPSPEFSRYDSPIPKTLAELNQIPVLILLGEPGYGKSHALVDERKRLEKEQADDLIIFEDLKTFVPGDEQRLLDSGKFKCVEEGRKIWILLDSLDECTISNPAHWLIANFIQKVDYPEQVFVRIICRPSHWPDLLEQAFSERWQSVVKSSVELWRLCPLRQEDIRTAADTNRINADDFLTTVVERNSEQLAALPVTLQFMLKLFKEKRLPKLRTEIFEQGLELLCEDSPERRISGTTSQIPAIHRFQVATRIALGCMLQGHNTIWLGPRVECPIGLFDANIVASTEGDLEITNQAIKETLELTGVFARLDGKRFQFASRTFAEFLAAWYIAKSRVPIQQKLKVLLNPDSQRLIPDLHETAAWLAALDADFLAWLVKHEPEAALEADFATLAQADLPALVDGMLSMAIAEQRPSYDWQRLAKLKYKGIEQQLSHVIADNSNSSSFSVRALAIRIVNACELQTLGAELAEVALNDQEDFELRSLAVSRMANMDNNARIRLIPLAESDNESSLKAKALSVLGPALMGAEAFFNQITPTYLESAPFDFRFIIDEAPFLDQLDVDGLKVGLKWITKHTPIGYDSFTSNRLKSRLLVRAFDHLNEKELVTEIVHAMKALHSHHEPFFDGLDRNESINPFDDVATRHIVVTELISQFDSESVSEWIFSRERCIRSEDCRWLFQQYDQERSDEKRRLIAGTINQLIQIDGNREAVEEVLSRAGVAVNDPDPILSESMAWLVRPIDLFSEATKSSREQYFRRKALNRKSNRQAKSLPNPPSFYIQTNLSACEAGDLDHWSDLIGSLALQEDGSYTFPHDPDSLPGWFNADDTIRNRITEVAIQYLESAVPPDDKVLLKSSRTLEQASCGLAVAIVTDADKLQRLSGEHLSRWCLVAVTHFFESEIRQRIFRKLRPIVTDAFDDAVLKKIDREAIEGSLRLLESCRDVWHPVFLQRLADTRINAPDWPFDSRLCLAEFLIQNNLSNITEHLVDWLDDPETANRCSVAIALLRYVPVQAWPNIQRLLIEDEEIAREVVLAIAYSGGYSDTIYSDLDEAQLGWLYDRLRELFPPVEDPPIPDNVYTPTRRHDTSKFRDEMIGRLKNMATPEAIKELDRICKAYPDSPWLVRVKADACKNLWRQERSRLTFADSIRLLSDANVSVVRTSIELMNVVEGALRRFAHEAKHGSPPLVTFLWDEKQNKPVSEQRLSDFLKFYLNREWRDGRIIINREVEIRNLRDFGIGERTDLFVQSVSTGGDTHQPQLSVVIEIKPDNQAKPQKDIPDQLVGKYLDGESRSCGIYLIGWFGKGRSTIDELSEKAVQCASENNSDRIKVSSIVVDLCHPLSSTKS
ncbi:MAG: NACHT domain-containing protein [Gammaproteobacteria bacterium]